MSKTLQGTIEIPYGRTKLRVPEWVPDAEDILMPGPFDDTEPEVILNDALDNPIDSQPVEEMFSPGDRLLCVIPDMTRRAAVSSYLPLLLKRLEEAGHLPQDINILVGLGIHRPMKVEELAEHVGQWVKDRYSVINHDPDNADELSYIGDTPGGIPVSVNSMAVRADGIILTGGVTYHYFAGYGGGRKGILPGIASRQTCIDNHKLVVRWRRGELNGELGPGVLMGNPIHEQMLWACSVLPRVFSLNVVTDPDGRVFHASAGEVASAHQRACKALDRAFRKTLEKKGKLVLAGAGGWPKDLNFVQAHKSLYSAHRAVDEEGVVILAASCDDGAGHPDMMSWFRKCKTDGQWLRALDSRYQINGQTAYSTWLRANRTKTCLVSELSPADVLAMGMIPCGDLKEALGKAEKILGELPGPVLMPDAGDILVDVSS